MGDPTAVSARSGIRRWSGTLCVAEQLQRELPESRRREEQFREAGFVPDIVQEEAGVQSLLGLVAAGVGVTRLACSAASLRRTGVVFVPLTSAHAYTEMVWLAGNTAPALRRFLDVVTELAATTDLTSAG
ncbi:LysR substrate-binding domain-containing protein [Micromonospora sp. DT53]|uniref:LysR substrate-binding domain-containing protein n=1 Tax=Micromonospora sp. DT53 TaxID=3393444 RepID=UPI003CEE2480